MIHFSPTQNFVFEFTGASIVHWGSIWIGQNDLRECYFELRVRVSCCKSEWTQVQRTSSVISTSFLHLIVAVAVVLCAGGWGGQGVQRGWLCEGGNRATYGHDCPRVWPEDKPHVTWHPAGGPDQGGEKPSPHFGQGQGPETDHWADLICTVSIHSPPQTQFS